MDILLTHGYFLSQDAHEAEVMKPYPPLGILSLSSYLKTRGFDVEVYDTTFQPPEAFYRFIEHESPPVVGIYANMLTRKTVLKMARFCGDRGATVVLGGPDPANYVESYLSRGVDVIVIGEGERTLEELLRHLGERGLESMGQIRGIAYQEAERRVVRTGPRPPIEDLDELPFADRAAIDLHLYLRVWREHHGRGAMSLMTARGCPYRCAWCSHAVFGYSHRRRSPGNVAQELTLLLEKYQPDRVWYADDVFTMDRAWLRTYARELERRSIAVPFEATSREDRLDEEVVRILAEMGCFRLWMGAESGSQRILDRMERRINARRVPEMVRLLQRHGIEAGLFVMLGYEGEKMADLEATAAMLEVAQPDRLLTVTAYPIKGTPYYRRVQERIVRPTPWEQGSDRDLLIAGRHSERFYSFATRWMVNRMRWRQHRQKGSRLAYGAVKALVNTGIGRLGMWLTDEERVDGS